MGPAENGLGITMEDEKEEINSIEHDDDDDVILTEIPPPLVIIDDDEDDENNDDSDSLQSKDLKFKNSGATNGEKEVINSDEIERNFHRFLESGDDPLYYYDDYSSIEPEVILAETGDSQEAIVNCDDNVKSYKYKCNVCGREVVSSYNLKRHMMIHTGKHI